MGCIDSGGYLNTFELDPTLGWGMRVPFKGFKVDDLQRLKVDYLQGFEGLKVDYLQRFKGSRPVKG